jgi:predicted nucleic acid-binding protein
MTWSVARRSLLPATAAPLPDWCPRRIADRRRSIERSRASGRCASTRGKSPWPNCRRPGTKGTSTDAVRHRCLHCRLLALEDEDHPVAALALEHIRTDTAHVPSLWWFEVRNTLIVNERRGRLTEADVTVFLRGLARLGVTIDRTPDEAAVLTLARRYRLTVYDASYLELAQREGVLLATLDTDLVNAARGERLQLIGE